MERAVQLAIVVSVVLVFAGTGGAVGVGQADADTVDVIIVFEDDAARNASVIEQAGGSVTGGHDISVVPVLFARIPPEAMDALEAHPAIELVERNEVVEQTDQISPWGVERIGGQRAAGSVGTNAQGQVHVAVIDTGVDYDHEDLTTNVVWGVRTVGTRATTTGLAAADDNNGHGTAMAGVIAAEDNDRGVVGVAPAVEVYAIKSLNANGTGTTRDVIEGIDHAVKGPDGERGTDDDADIISMSFGSTDPNAALEAAVEDASDDTLLIAAAGNNGDGDPSTDNVTYPARYTAVIAVAATDTGDETPRWSSEGDTVELAAPGVSVRSTYLDDGYVRSSGTSMATPHVAGTAALLLADDLADGNRDRSFEWIRDRLRDTASDIEADGVDRESGYGIVQADAALGVASNTPPNVELRKPAEGATVAGSVTVRIAATDAEDRASEITVEISIDGGPWQEARYDSAADEHRFKWDTSDAAEDEEHTISVRATDSGGMRDTDEGTVTVDNVDNAPNASIVHPENGSTVTGTVNIEIDASDDRADPGELEATYTVDDGAPRTLSYNSTADRYDASWDTAGVSDGRHTLTVEVSDGSNSVENRHVVTVANTAPSSESIDLNATDVTVTPGENATTEFVLTNTGENHRVVGLSVTSWPDGWGIVGQSSDGGQWANSRQTWFWIDPIPPNSSVSASVRFCVPNETAVGNYSITGVATDSDGNQAEISGAVEVQDVRPPLVVMAGDDRILQLRELLTVIDRFNEGTPVPGTNGQSLTIGDVLRAVEYFNSGETVVEPTCEA